MCINSNCNCGKLNYHSDTGDRHNTNLGWECPRCHKIHGPHIDSCDCESLSPIWDYQWYPNVDSGTITDKDPKNYKIVFPNYNQTGIGSWSDMTNEEWEIMDKAIND
jgi:hypothetical protein